MNLISYVDAGLALTAVFINTAFILLILNRTSLPRTYVAFLLNGYAAMAWNFGDFIRFQILHFRKRRHCMNKKALVFLWPCLVWILPFTAKAQEKGEISVFGGYSYRWNTNENHGWHASIAGNIARHLAIVGDFSGHYGSNSYAGYAFQTGDRSRGYAFLFGPRYVHTIQKRWTPFAHALVGVERHSSEGWYSWGGETNKISYGPNPDNVFAVAFGGGLDINLCRRISVRALQVDGVGIADGGFWGYYVRASVGVVFHLNKLPE
jgi:hypothetical protein